MSPNIFPHIGPETIKHELNHNQIVERPASHARTSQKEKRDDNPKFPNPVSPSQRRIQLRSALAPEAHRPANQSTNQPNSTACPTSV